MGTLCASKRDVKSIRLCAMTVNAFAEKTIRIAWKCKHTILSKNYQRRLSTL